MSGSCMYRKPAVLHNVIDKKKNLNSGQFEQAYFEIYKRYVHTPKPTPSKSVYQKVVEFKDTTLNTVNRWAKGTPKPNTEQAAETGTENRGAVSALIRHTRTSGGGGGGSGEWSEAGTAAMESPLVRGVAGTLAAGSTAYFIDGENRDIAAQALAQAELQRLEEIEKASATAVENAVAKANIAANDYAKVKENTFVVPRFVVPRTVSGSLPETATLKDVAKILGLKKADALTGDIYKRFGIADAVKNRNFVRAAYKMDGKRTIGIQPEEFEVLVAAENSIEALNKARKDYLKHSLVAVEEDSLKNAARVLIDFNYYNFRTPSALTQIKHWWATLPAPVIRVPGHGLSANTLKDFVIKKEGWNSLEKIIGSTKEKGCPELQGIYLDSLDKLVYYKVGGHFKQFAKDGFRIVNKKTIKTYLETLDLNPVLGTIPKNLTYDTVQEFNKMAELKAAQAAFSSAQPKLDVVPEAQGEAKPKMKFPELEISKKKPKGPTALSPAKTTSSEGSYPEKGESIFEQVVKWISENIL